MKKADGSGAEFALIVGENEIQAGQVVVKALRADVAQQTVAADAVLATLATLKA